MNVYGRHFQVRYAETGVRGMIKQVGVFNYL